MNNKQDNPNCQFCKFRQIKFMQKEIHQKYFEQFNFYFAKPITEILANVPVDHVILFKDQLYLHDENEYMKRFYQREEQDPRLNLLCNFYFEQHKIIQPNLCKVNAHKFMEKRQNKLLKLQQKAQNNQNQQPITKKMIPDHIFSENYVESVSDSYPKEQISWDSKSHNIYEISQVEAQKSLPQNKPTQQCQCSIINISGDHNKLFNCQNDQELDNIFNDLNTQTSRHLSVITKIPLKKKQPSNSNVKKNPQSQQQSQQPKIPIPPLKLQESAKSSTTTAANNNKSTSIQSLMKKYDQILQKRFQVKEILTERNDTRYGPGYGTNYGVGTVRGEGGSSKKQITDEMLLKLIQNMKKSKNKSDNYQFHASYKSVIQQAQIGPTQSCTFEKENEKKKKYQVYLVSQNKQKKILPRCHHLLLFKILVLLLSYLDHYQIHLWLLHLCVDWKQKSILINQFNNKNKKLGIGLKDAKFVEISFSQLVDQNTNYVLQIYFKYTNYLKIKLRMSINYAQLRKSGRRQSVNTDFMQYHKLSQTFTESFPVSLQRTKPNFKNQLSQLEFDDHQIDFKNHPFTFQDKINQKTEVTKKKFIFDEHQSTKQGEFKNFMSAMDDYINLLNESSDCLTLNSENYSQLENILFAKFNIIRQKHEELNKKYKMAQQNFKAQRYQNQLLKKQIVDIHSQLEEEKQKNFVLLDINEKLKKKYRDLQNKTHFVQNSFMQDRMKFDHKRQNQFQQSISVDESDRGTTQQTYETNDDQQNVTKFLKTQMRKLRQNNQQIDDYSRLYKKISEHNNDDF
ncbi:unnamed protein product [Paramecium pentaurelia]|uniref:Uncharacterized protein n=2 Tax=Paramecium TaxID=5884 RepID=A0A8S1TAH7_9CILI|nr:unnamed protein product [Paramecium pentaurelia]